MDEEIYFLVECAARGNRRWRRDRLVVIRLDGREFRGEYPRAAAKARGKALRYLVQCGFDRAAARRYLRLLHREYETGDG